MLSVLDKFNLEMEENDLLVFQEIPKSFNRADSFHDYRSFFAPLALNKLKIKERIFIDDFFCTRVEKILMTYLEEDRVDEKYLEEGLQLSSKKLVLAFGQDQLIFNKIIKVAKIWKLKDIGNRSRIQLDSCSTLDSCPSVCKFTCIISLITFCTLLQIFRKSNKFELSNRGIKALKKSIDSALDFCHSRKLIIYPLELMLMGCTYYTIVHHGGEEPKKQYLSSILGQHPIFKEAEYWESSLLYLVSKSRNKCYQKMEQKDREEVFTCKQNLKMEVVHDFVSIFTHMNKYGGFQQEILLDMLGDFKNQYSLNKSQHGIIYNFVIKSFRNTSAEELGSKPKDKSPISLIAEIDQNSDTLSIEREQKTKKERQSDYYQEEEIHKGPRGHPILQSTQSMTSIDFDS